MHIEDFQNLRGMAWLVFAVINIVSFLYVFWDKRKAVKNYKRTPEIDFFLWGIFGGSLGILSGMYLFHHKTRKWYFVVGFIALLVQNILAVLRIIEVIK